MTVWTITKLELVPAILGAFCGTIFFRGVTANPNPSQPDIISNVTAAFSGVDLVAALAVVSAQVATPDPFAV